MQGRDYDVDYVSIRFCLPAGPEHERVLDCIRLFGEEVLPRFHKWGRFANHSPSGLKTKGVSWSVTQPTSPVAISGCGQIIQRNACSYLDSHNAEKSCSTARNRQVHHL